MKKTTPGLSVGLGVHFPPHRRRALGWMVLGTAILALAAGVSMWGERLVGITGQYVVVVALVIAWMSMVGLAFNGRAEGLLIDGRNLISLSRLQLFVWLVIVGSAFAIEVAHNFQPGVDLKLVKVPDGVKVPTRLGLVMGAATTSFVASPAILALKTRSTSTVAERTNARRFARDGARLHPNSGRLYARKLGEPPRWADLFRGEELETAGSADPAKIQQFLVTLMLATIYLVLLRSQFQASNAVRAFTELPAISEGGLILLSISHAAYLGGKAAPQTPGGWTSDPEIPHIDTAPQTMTQVPPPPAEPPASDF